MKKLFAFLVFACCLLAASLALAVNGLDSTPIGANNASTGKFSDLEVEASGTFTLGGQTATSINGTNGIDGRDVKASTNDTSPGFLDTKVLPGAGIDVDTTNPIQITISSTVSPADDNNDGVDITFAREILHGSGNVPALDIRGTNIYDNSINPTVEVGGKARTVLSAADIPNTTPTLQKVIVDRAQGDLPANYKLRLENSLGNSNFYMPLSQTYYDGSDWDSATITAPWNRYQHVSVAFDGKLWVMGGHDGTSFTNDIQSSSDGGFTWNTVVTNGTMWNPRGYFTALVFVDPADGVEKMWIFGGYAGIFYNDVWNSADGITWNQVTTIGTVWSGRHVHASVVHNGKMWVIGGQPSSNVNINDVWSSPDGVTWTEENSNALWTPRYAHTVLSFDDKLWVMGGFGGGRKNDVWSSSDDGATWDPEPNAGWSARHYHTSVVYNNKMWVMGGYTGSYPQDVWSTGDGDTWVEETNTAAWPGRRDATSVVYDNKIWFIGGRDQNVNVLNDVWHTSE